MLELELTTAERRAIEEMFIHVSKADHFGVLGIHQNTQPAQIREAYYRLSREWHPDRYFRHQLGDYAGQVEAIFIKISVAYRELTDDVRREAYRTQHRVAEDQRRRTRTSTVQSKHQPQPTPTTHETTLPPRSAKASTAESEAKTTARATSTKPKTPSSPSVDRSESTSDPDSTRPAEARTRARGTGRKRVRRRAVAAAKQQRASRHQQAKQHYDDAKAKFEAGQVLAAVSAMHLATRYDRKNKTYQKFYEELQRNAKNAQAKQFILAAQNAESFQNVREAMENYLRAVKYDPDDGTPYYRLASLIKVYKEDLRNAMSYMRIAVQKNPDNPTFRVALGDIYLEAGMKLNARREFQAALEVDPDLAAAKEGLRKSR